MAKIEEKFKNLPLRNCVGIVVLDKDNKVFVAKRIDNPKDYWQMPQGGVNDKEQLLSAAFRELEEETSIKNVELIQEIDGNLTYELPKHLLGIIWKGKYKGQKQKWFLMRFLGTEKEIYIKTSIDVLNWEAKSSLDALNQVCLEQHTGPDGKNVLWPNVDITVIVDL